MKIKSFIHAGLSNNVHIITGAFSLLLSTAVIANPTYKVFFDGGGVNANSVVALGGAADLPEGVCGMRISGADLLYEFYWAEYNAYSLGSPMSEPPWGPPSSATYEFPNEALEAVIEFTGPLSDNCEDEWVFHLPLTGEWPTWPNGIPSEAGAFVFQVVLPNNIEWLNAGFQVWEPSGKNPGGGKDPETPTTCEQFPDLLQCGGPGGYAVDSPCNSLIVGDLCDAVKQINEFSVRAEKQALIVVKELNAITKDNSAAQIKKVLGIARKALQESKSFELVKLDLEEQAFRDDSSNLTIEHISSARAHIGIAKVAFRGCLNQIEKAQRNLSVIGKNVKTSIRTKNLTDIDLAIIHCMKAVESLIVTRDEVGRALITSIPVKKE